MADENLYLIRVYNENEDFLKIGVTVHKYCRFHQIIKKGYNIDILYMLLGIEFYEAHNHERKLQKHFFDYSYLPNTKFGGYTECFQNIDIDEYKYLTKDILHKKRIENLTINYAY